MSRSSSANIVISVISVISGHGNFVMMTCSLGASLPYLTSWIDILLPAGHSKLVLICYFDITISMVIILIIMITMNIPIIMIMVLSIIIIMTSWIDILLPAGHSKLVLF